MTDFPHDQDGIDPVLLARAVSSRATPEAETPAVRPMPALEAAPEWHLANLLRFICPDPRNLKGARDDDGFSMEVHLRVGDVRDAHRSVASCFGSDGQEEARWIKSMEDACPHCGGSGHKDDVSALEPAPAPIDMRKHLEGCVKLLEALVIESGNEVPWDGEDAFRMGEWFEDQDIAVIHNSRQALNGLEPAPVQGWQDITTLPKQPCRVIVGGWKKATKKIPRYFWFHEDEVIADGKLLDRPHATVWHPMPPAPQDGGQ